MKASERSLCLLLSIAYILILITDCNRMPEGNAADGERWFKLNRCDGCHGKNGSGGKGPVIAATSLGFYRFLRKLRSPKSASMPAFTSQELSDKDAGEIYLWLVQQKEL